MIGTRIYTGPTPGSTTPNNELMINRIERKIIEAVRNSKTVKVSIDNLTIRVDSKRFAHDVAIALQTYVNSQKSELNYRNNY